MSNNYYSNIFSICRYAKIKTERLYFIRLNPTNLRTEEYIHLHDAVANGDNMNSNALRKI